MFSGNKIVVTGSAGFLGGRTAAFLATHFPNHSVVATSRRVSRKEELEKHGCIFVGGDLTDAAFCDQLTQDVKIIVHCAALSSPWGTYDEFFQANVVATQKLAEACIKNSVQKFIFISTPSIYFNYHDRINVREDEPLPRKMVNHYAATKLLAENYVLGCNGKGISTLALRPRAIIGAEDTVIFPRVLEAYKTGKLKIVGNGKNVCDLTCVKNVIEAICCSIDAPENAFGQAYNITNGEPVNFWNTLNYLLKNLGLEPPEKRVPKNIALLAARIVEWKAQLLNEEKEPALTRYGIGILSNNFTMDISKAREKLGYKPVQTTLNGINEFIEWYKLKN